MVHLDDTDQVAEFGTKTKIDGQKIIDPKSISKLEKLNSLLASCKNNINQFDNDTKLKLINIGSMNIGMMNLITNHAILSNMGTLLGNANTQLNQLQVCMNFF